MRKGYDPAMFLNKKGRMFGFCTGSGPCSEHEQGSRSMQEALCRKDGLSDEQLIKKLRQESASPSASSLASASANASSLASVPLVYPTLLDRKSLVSDLKRITLLEGTDKKTGEPVAMIHFSANGRAPSLEDRELSLEDRELSLGYQKTVAGAWDPHGFAFKVWGERDVKRLQAFHTSMLAGNGVFAGTFLKSHDGVLTSGVAIVDRTLLRGEHLAEIKKAQEKWEADMRLKADSKLYAFYERFSRARQKDPEARHIDLPGSLWAVWRNEVDGEIAYALNPGYRVKAPYYGPYDLEQLERWTFAEKKFDLVPLPKIEAPDAKKTPRMP